MAEKEKSKSGIRSEYQKFILKAHNINYTEYSRLPTEKKKVIWDSYCKGE